MAPVGAAHTGDAHGVKVLQNLLPLEVLVDEKPPAHPLVKTSGRQADPIQCASKSHLADLIHLETAASATGLGGWQIWGASPSSHSWANLQLSPFLQEPGFFLWALQS